MPYVKGTNVIALRSSKVGAVYVEIGAFRDWFVGDSYGQIDGRIGPRPAEPE